ncbi:uncharacterized protein LOC130726011 [Lotus japonicus]|uniref:uncharacterized protein LOC130726011 n=1 Tax=Lotus japonicus TaxID=34305 RepID=UPI002587CA29|nr:uncharacterized protein LOC130726011 [Lotus japonicus]
MAESSSTCLVPEGDPIRALSESISFGRFMSERLDWEKWSAFTTHKRYVEEAEKYSKPGSVAAKKAYFEAHYKRKAAEEEAALIQEENAQVNGAFDSKTKEGNCTDSSIVMKSKANSHETANEQLGEEDAVVDCADTNQYNEFDPVEVHKDVSHPCADINHYNEFDPVEVHKNLTILEEEKKPEPGTAGEEILAFPVEGEAVNSSPKLSTNSKASKLSHPLDERKASAGVPPPPRNGINCVSKSKMRVGVRDTVEKKRLTAGSLHMSIDLPSGTRESSKIASAALQSRNGLNSFSTSQKSVGGSLEKKRIIAPSLSKSINLSSGTGVSNKTATAAVKSGNGISLASKSMKSDLVEKKSTARSLHMSINLSSGADKRSKTASAFEHNRIKRIACNLPKDRPLALQTSTPTKASHGLLKEASENPLSQSRRTERLLNKSLCGGVTVNANRSSLSVMCSKPVSTIGSQTHTKSLPFRFRSEERAIKRKERMDEIKPKEEEKVQLQRIPKGKAEHDHKKLQQSGGSKFKLNEDGSSGTQSSTKQVRKVSLTMSGPPKPDGKASSSTVQDKTIGSSWKPPINTNSSKHITEKANRTTKQSRTSSNTTRENASPNIQN